MTTATASCAAFPHSVSNRFVVVAGILVTTWFIAILALGSQGLFTTDRTRPPFATLIAILLPPTLFLLSVMLRAVRREILALDPVWLTAMQGLRILGAGFLFVYAFGHLPALFAHVAGWGDMIVAMLAPIMAAKLAQRRSFIRSNAFLGFHIFGVADFVAAVGSGLIARGTVPLLGLTESTAALGQLPLVLIPCFAVPLWICLHIAAFLQIGEARRRGPDGSSEGR